MQSPKPQFFLRNEALNLISGLFDITIVSFHLVKLQSHNR